MKCSIFTISLLLTTAICLNNQHPLRSSEKHKKHSVAVIGAGAAGSSSAYHLNKYAGDNVEITVFEQNDYIGGRSTTIDINGTTAELGGSIFAGENKILHNAVKEFNLSLIDFHGDDSDSNGLGIWNGTGFNFLLKPSGLKIPYWNELKFIWRFGWSVFKTEYKRKEALNIFLNSFYEQDFPFVNANISPALLELTGVTGFDYLNNSVGVSADYQTFIESITRVNYAQNLDQIHAMGVLVSLSANGAKSVKGGNWKIFENWIKSSSATLKLSTKVESISKESEKYLISFTNSTQANSTTESQLFDKVIIAAQSPELLIGLGDANVPTRNSTYVQLYVTILKSKTQLSSSTYFNSTSTPQTILTTSGFSLFNSISEIGYDNSTSEFIYKIFSLSQPSSGFLNNVFNEGITFKFQKIWNSYPYLSTVSEFDDFEVDDGVWYLNEFERFVSTMETEALVGASVAGLISFNGGFNVTEIVLDV